MARIIKVGAGGSEIDWHEALKDLRADDVLLIEPGFYELPQGLELTDITLKGMGSTPEDTTILGYISTSEDSRFVNLENLCINTNTDHNSLSVPTEANGYLSLRNCIIKGTNTDTAAIAINGKTTLELYSTKVINGSLSMFANSDFRLEMNDSVIDYASDEFCALALEGKGTAIINNSCIHGSTNTFEKTNMELDINNSKLDYILLRGQTWLNMLNSEILSTEDSCLYISDSCWSNIVGSKFHGGVFLDKETRTIIQNCTINRMIAVDKAKITMTNSQIIAHADFQDEANADATRVGFNGNMDYEYFLALSGRARLAGHDLILNANDSQLAVQDDAHFNTNVLASDKSSIEVECNKVPNVKIMGMHWTAKKK
ncbi:hypothetical protein GCM10022297_02770 [Lactobacillus hamsteri]|uniref:Right handed beta helix domain-containing protein n=1 Tax=Lactobacillus hamsteri DSM 5661 = JCM 6256 TaxID=1423754 RepID=A0A0R1YD16_9LACO|nr:hypothetical protein [Lactobacillus hamsteri]KRM40269.1 hypothetical protein FC39_GL000741 [Lactobacillus hamsteri DSM 5661 = JCM 6256]